MREREKRKQEFQGKPMNNFRLLHRTALYATVMRIWRFRQSGQNPFERNYTAECYAIKLVTSTFPFRLQPQFNSAKS